VCGWGLDVVKAREQGKARGGERGWGLEVIKACSRASTLEEGLWYPLVSVMAGMAAAASSARTDKVVRV